MAKMHTMLFEDESASECLVLKVMTNDKYESAVQVYGAIKDACVYWVNSTKDGYRAWEAADKQNKDIDIYDFLVWIDKYSAFQELLVSDGILHVDVLPKLTEVQIFNADNNLVEVWELEPDHSVTVPDMPQYCPGCNADVSWAWNGPRPVCCNHCPTIIRE